MPKPDGLVKHIEHAKYSRDRHRSAANESMCKWRHYGRIEDYQDWKNNIRIAWRMRAIVRNNKV